MTLGWHFTLWDFVLHVVIACLSCVRQEQSILHENSILWPLFLDVVLAKCLSWLNSVFHETIILWAFFMR